MPYAWQSETCLGDWHYDRALFDKPGEYGGYLQPRDVIHWLIDTVSKNGTFILNVPGKPDGTIDSKEIAVLDRITDWMQTNGEAIYETRPWKSMARAGHGRYRAASRATASGRLARRIFVFTSSKNGKVLYTRLWVGRPESSWCQSLGTSSPNAAPEKSSASSCWAQRRSRAGNKAADGLHVELPEALQARRGFPRRSE